MCHAHTIEGSMAASPPRRRDQHCHHPTDVARSSPRIGRATVEESTALRTKIADTTAGQQSGCTMAPRGSLPRAPLPPSALLPHGLFATRRMLPFGLDNATTSLARTIFPGTSTCVDRPLALPCDMETRGKLNMRLSVQVFSRYASLDGWDLDGTPSPRSGSSWQRSGTAASTPLN